MKLDVKIKWKEHCRSNTNNLGVGENFTGCSAESQNYQFKIN